MMASTKNQLIWISALCITMALSSKHEPKKCGKRFQCPSYTVDQSTENNEDYEIRTLHPAKLAVVDFSSLNSTGQGFWKLYNYIRNNKIDMTAPVLMEQEIAGGLDDVQGMERRTMSFFMIPKEGQTIPEPTDPMVTLVNWDTDITVFVRSYGGFSTNKIALNHLNKLVDALKRDGISIESDAEVFVAGYDAPFWLFNRHNEVWIVQYAL